MDECLYQGSPLQTEINNNNKIESMERFYEQSKIALSERPTSKFWKEATEHMAKKLKKMGGEVWLAYQKKTISHMLFLEMAT